MLQHNLLITFRSFLRNRGSFWINLLGLSTGLTCALLIFLWVQDELSTDKFHQNDSQLYQLMRKLHTPTGISVGDWVPGPLAESIRDALPEVTSITSYKTHVALEGNVSLGDEHLKSGTHVCRSTLFRSIYFSVALWRQNQSAVGQICCGHSLKNLAVKLFHRLQKLPWERSFNGNRRLVQIMT